MKDIISKATQSKYVVFFFVLNLTPLLLFSGTINSNNEGPKSAMVKLRVQYGDVAPNIVTKDVYDQIFELASYKGRVVLIEFLGSMLFDSPNLLKYTNVLAQKYHAHGLTTVCILNDKKFSVKRVKKLLDELSISHTIFCKGFQGLDTLYGVPLGSSATVLIDSSGVVRFAQPLVLGNDSKRQLVEKFILGAPIYSFQGMDDLESVFEINAEMPDVNLIDVVSGHNLTLRELYGNSTLCLVFSAKCGPCKIRNFLSAVKEIENALAAETEPRNLICIFEDNLTEEEIKNLWKEKDIRSSVFQTSDWKNLDRDYITRRTDASKPMVIYFDSHGIIRYIENLKDFRKAIPDRLDILKNFDKEVDDE